VNSTARLLNPSEAAKQLGVSVKALRLYEERGLLAPARTAAGWRTYGPEQMARATEIVELRALGLTLSEVAWVLGGDTRIMRRALAAHEASLENRIGHLGDTLQKVRRLREELERGTVATATEIVRLLKPINKINVAFDLPWPWGGEHFELRDIRTLNYIVGPLGSGKTRLAMRLAEVLPDAEFISLDRLADDGETCRSGLDANLDLKARVERTLASLIEDGGTASNALLVLLATLEAEGHAILVIDMLEQGLDTGTQEALIGHLRRRGPNARSLFLLTRSSSILDLESVGDDEAIIFCPANHSPPIRVASHRGATGYEAVATCLASPEVRARTAGIIAWRPTSK
jgi:DNA-binding transcriptional MerR regulator